MPTWFSLLTVDSLLRWQRRLPSRLDIAADLRLVRRLMGARMRSDWQYRTSFLTYLAGQAMVTALEFIAILLLLELVPDLGGWTGTQVAFLYGLASVPFALTTLTIATVERLPLYVRTGNFDRLLLRPVPAMLQLMALEFELRRIGKLIAPALVLVWAVPRLDVAWTATSTLALAVALLCGTGIYAALWILSASVAFWTVASQEATNSVTYGGEYASQYPLHLYRGWIRAVIGWAIPLAFVAYVPAVFLFEQFGSVVGAGAGVAADGVDATPLALPTWLFYATPAVAAAALGLAVTVWSVGIRHYQSTGS